jgi:dephospho-CoA kinase
MHENGRVIIGVAGAICSGKTIVSKIFEELGAHYVSADKIGWQVLPEITDELRERFGENIMTGTTVDRKKLRDIVFSSNDNVAFLNQLSHPRLVKELIARIEEIRTGIVVVDAALLFEWPRVLDIVDHPMLVTASEHVKKERAMKQCMDEDTFSKIQRAQKHRELMKKKAAYVIENNGTFDELREQCTKIFKEIQSDC